MCVLAAVLIVGLAPAAWAQDAQSDPRESKPERPTVATHAHAVAIGIAELETGFQFQHPVPGSSVLSFPVLVKIGLADHLQLDLAPAFLRTSADGAAVGGLGDSQIGLKWQIATGAPAVGDFALQALVKLPTGSTARETGTGTTDLGLLAISSREFGPFALDLNAGYTRRSGDGSRAPVSSTFWTCSLGVEFSDRLGWVAEVFGYPGTAGPAGSPAVVAFLTGPMLVLRKSLVVDVGAIVNVSGFGGTAAYAGLTWNMGRLWSPPRRPQPAS